jgi:hypothetical protein
MQGTQVKFDSRINIYIQSYETESLQRVTGTVMAITHLNRKQDSVCRV